MPDQPLIEQSRFCVVCSRWSPSFGPGPGGRRTDASCPHCGSLERHRLLILLLLAMTNEREHTELVDVAPMTAIAERLRADSSISYIGLDFDPAADRREVTMKASITAIPLRSDSVDLLTCYHVLEHVPDDRAGMREIERVLSPAGVGLVQVPRKGGVPTDEDPHASPSERIKRFGQADHVRYYGDDFETRLEEAGLAYRQVRPETMLRSEHIERVGMAPREVVWLVASESNGASTRLAALEQDLRNAVPTELLLAMTTAPNPVPSLSVCLAETARALDMLAGEAKMHDGDGNHRYLQNQIDDLRRRVEAIETWVNRWDGRYRAIRMSPPARSIASTVRRLRKRPMG